MDRIFLHEEDFVEVYVKAARGLKKHTFVCEKNAHYELDDTVMKVKINGQLVWERKKS